MKQILLGTQFALVFVATYCSRAEKFSFQEADIIFQESKSQQSAAIKAATNSRYTHVGMVTKRGDKVFVLEAVEPVKLTSLSVFLNRSVGNHYVVKRFKNSQAVLTPDKIKRMKKLGLAFLGLPYDWEFGWSDNRIYCSELVWKIFERGAGITLSPTRKLKEFDLGHASVKAKMKERYGSKIPYDEPVVAPSQLYDSELLETVYRQ